MQKCASFRRERLNLELEKLLTKFSNFWVENPVWIFAEFAEFKGIESRSLGPIEKAYLKGREFFEKYSSFCPEIHNNLKK